MNPICFFYIRLKISYKNVQRHIFAYDKPALKYMRLQLLRKVQSGYEKKMNAT